MKVKSIMTRSVTMCSPADSLRQAARTMREIDSGILPVAKDDEIVGVITDRDICLALAEHDRRLSEITVGDAMSRGVLTCGEEDGVRTALAKMRSRRIRRLPVVDAEGHLSGILSINDVIRHTEREEDGQAISYGDTVLTLQNIGEHRYPAAPERPVDVTELARFV